MSPYNFTSSQDWVTPHMLIWKGLFGDVTTRTSSPRVLEVGSWEGRSAVFLLTELCKSGGSIVCVDHFDLLDTEDGRERYNKIKHNLQATGNENYRILPQFSIPALTSLLEEEIDKKEDEAGFDWVYIDGSHEADDTLLDGELCWRLAKKEAIVVFDDYHWAAEPEDSRHHPKRGIDAFLELHKGEYTKLSDPSQYQVVLRKSVDMRIGFLVQDRGNVIKTNNVFGYGVNIALAIDSPFSMPAAVTMWSTVVNTPGRISFHIVDCGLTEDDRIRLRKCLPESRDVTLSFHPLPIGNCAKDLGPIWTKLDLHHVLPVERILYLDADTLVRSDLRPLWETSLGDRTIAAVPDVGYPMGHHVEERRPYFNAGVMVMNLTKIRESGEEMLGLARDMRKSRFHDQDALNVYFKDWAPLSLKWNAQGLGTYAKYSSTDRNKLDLGSMEDPAIVHFTGPVNPSVVEVLNPHVQPPVAKPWGYIGSPGHPFAGEWWRVLAETPYASYTSSNECVSRRNEVIEGKLNDIAKEFRRRVSDTI